MPRDAFDVASFGNFVAWPMLIRQGLTVPR
jgi:hypothetical protein